MTTAELATLLTAIGAIALGVINARQSAKKSELDALQIIIDAMESENARLRLRVDELEKKNIVYENYISRLIGQLRENGIKPHPMTPEHGEPGDARPAPKTGKSRGWE